MNANGRGVGRGLFIVAALVCLAGCSSSAVSTGMSLFDQIGGMGKVTQLANAFGNKLAGNETLSKVLSSTDITQSKLGLINEVAKASGMAPPHEGADLFSTLSGKGLDEKGVGAINSALSSAAGQVGLKGPAKDAVMGAVEPITNRLIGK